MVIHVAPQANIFSCKNIIAKELNLIEKRIADAFVSLGLEGEELSFALAEQLVKQCQIKGLTTEDVLLGKTPQGIAARWMHRRLSEQAERHEDEQTGKSYPLLPFSEVVRQDMVLRDGERRWSFPVLLRAKASEVDADRLSAAVETVVAHHPVFSMKIDEDGQQHYERGYRSPYLQTRVYEEDGYVYLSLTLNRILGDAASFVLLAQNIWRAYRGEALPHDGYLQYLAQYERNTHSHEYAAHAQWLTEHYDAPSCPLRPQPDSPEGLLPATASQPIILQPDYTERLETFSQRHHISVNAFFCLATALAIMDYNGTDRAGLTWAYLGRETRQEMNIFGSLHRDIPMRMVRQAHQPNQYSTTVPSLLTQLREQMEQGILHSDFPFTLTSPEDSPWHNAVNVLVQPSLAEAFEGCPAAFEPMPTGQPSESYCMLDIDITLSPLTITINYSPRHYTEQSIERFANLIHTNALQLLSNS